MAISAANLRTNLEISSLGYCDANLMKPMLCALPQTVSTTAENKSVETGSAATAFTFSAFTSPHKSTSALLCSTADAYQSNNITNTNTTPCCYVRTNKGDTCVINTSFNGSNSGSAIINGITPFESRLSSQRDSFNMSPSLKSRNGSVVGGIDGSCSLQLLQRDSHGQDIALINHASGNNSALLGWMRTVERVGTDAPLKSCEVDDSGDMLQHPLSFEDASAPTAEGTPVLGPQTPCVHSVSSAADDDSKLLLSLGLHCYYDSRYDTDMPSTVAAITTNSTTVKKQLQQDAKVAAPTNSSCPAAAAKTVLELPSSSRLRPLQSARSKQSAAAVRAAVAEVTYRTAIFDV